MKLTKDQIEKAIRNRIVTEQYCEGLIGTKYYHISEDGISDIVDSIESLQQPTASEMEGEMKEARRLLHTCTFAVNNNNANALNLKSSIENFLSRTQPTESKPTEK